MRHLCYSFLWNAKNCRQLSLPAVGMYLVFADFDQTDDHRGENDIDTDLYQKIDTRQTKDCVFRSIGKAHLRCPFTDLFPEEQAAAN